MDAISIDVLDFYARDNAGPHHTDRFEDVVVEQRMSAVRRGQPFKGGVRFQRDLDVENDIVQFIFSLGNDRNVKTYNAMYMKPDSVSNPHTWSVKMDPIHEEMKNFVYFEVSTPVDAPVGNWAVQVVTRRRESAQYQVYEYDKDLYILFNPWNPDDQTFMEDTDLLQEYVMNDIGKIWVGPINTTRGKPWMFGQFDSVVLPACTFVLNRAQIPFKLRGDPIELCRAISRIVNSNDDQGVLVGRWDGQYEDGTAPADWTNSVDILEEYLMKEQEVAYGQCWVFAAVVTTVCRALGIPSRVVSNIVSAHDANSTLTVDKYYAENMTELDYDPNNREGADSIWNYHVWNDVWMARPDLPPGYGGWQAIDATPQEMSQGFFQCGPASLEAIKQGIVGFRYDVEFMLASVNADMMRWREDPTSPSGYSMVDTNIKHIGRMILTKKPYTFDPNGDQDREDIISQYKYTEGSASERAALMTGVHNSKTAPKFYNVDAKPKDVVFSLVDIDTIPIGQPFTVAMSMENTSEEVRNIKVAVTVNSVFYTGVRAHVISQREGNFTVEPGQTRSVSVKIPVEDYLPKLVEYCNIKMIAMAIVNETQQSWADEDDFQILKPDIKIQFNRELVRGEEAVATLSLTNPLDRTLTGCTYKLSSTGIENRTVKIPLADVPPLGVLSAQLPIIPKREGRVTFIASFDSAELKDIKGAASLDVE